MPRKAAKKLTPRDIAGLKYLREIQEVLAPLRQVKAHGNRVFMYEDAVSLLLLMFFNPTLTSLRGLQQAAGLENVQEALGVKRASLGAMSRSVAHVFDPELLRPVLEGVIEQIGNGARHGGLPDTLPADVRAHDGSVLPCVPSMAWALFRTRSNHKAAKMHLSFSVSRSIPVNLELTAANQSEKAVLRTMLVPGSLYLLDRGYIEYALFQEIHDAGSLLVARIKDNATCEELKTRPLSGADAAAGVLGDQEVKIGSAFTVGDLTAPARRVTIRTEEGKELILLTNMMDVPAAHIGQAYRCRWQVELFFRWFKCILGCTHWVSHSRTGMTIQVYVAILASLLVSLWTGRKPTKRTFEMVMLYLQGWASAAELRAHVEQLKPAM